MGKFNCPKCGLANLKTETFPTLPHPLFGNYNTYNTNAAALVASKAFDTPFEKIQKAFKDFKPAFGRQEEIKYKGRKIMILLSKNPAGFNQSIDALKQCHSERSEKSFVKRNSLRKDPSPKAQDDNRCNILLVLNDRIPDGRDVSWIWDVDMERLFDVAKKIYISGDRAYDMGLRIKYSSPSKFQIEENLNNAVEKAVEQTEKNEILFILPTYSAMLETRKILTGREIL